MLTYSSNLAEILMEDIIRLFHEICCVLKSSFKGFYFFFCNFFIWGGEDGFNNCSVIINNSEIRNKSCFHYIHREDLYLVPLFACYIFDPLIRSQHFPFAWDWDAYHYSWNCWAQLRGLATASDHS